jgi:thiamine biosynthesis lipoprotein
MPLNTINRSLIAMDTVISLKVVSSQPAAEINECISRVFEIFRFVEETCSRFDDNSELRRLSLMPGIAKEVSPLLFEAIRFAKEIAILTKGAFDPTVGHILEKNGFSRHYITGQSPIPVEIASHVSFLDLEIDDKNRTVTLKKPMLLDLGAIAKGLAVDLSKQELIHFEGYLINAGGDLFAGGLNEEQVPWNIGIQHPLIKDKTICSLHVTDMAVCTSGGYERSSPLTVGMHHLLDSRTNISRKDLLSCTAISPFAMLADGLSTAAFILGQQQGLDLFSMIGLEGLWITSTLETITTTGMQRYIQ